MKCSDVKPLLSLYIDKQLDMQKMDNIKNHLISCYQCNNEYNDLMEILADISEIPQLELPDGFSQNLHLRLQKEASGNIGNANSKVVSFTNVWGKIKAQGRVPISIGLAAACTLIVFSTGIFNNISPKDYSNQKTDIVQTTPENKSSSNPPAIGNADVALQVSPTPATQSDNNVALTPQTPPQSRMTQEFGQSSVQTSALPIELPAQTQPNVQRPATQGSTLKDGYKAPTPSPSASTKNVINGYAPTSTMAATDNKSTTGGLSEASSESSILSSTPKMRANILSKPILAKTMYVETNDPQKVIDALGDVKQRFSQVNDRSIITLTEDEFNQLTTMINDFGGDLSISYGYENSADLTSKFMIIIVKK